MDDDTPGFDGGPEDVYDDLDEGLDPEGPSRADLERFGDEFLTCPECGADVYDQTALCPECGHAFGNLPGPTPVWMIVTAIAVVVAILAFIVLF